jgi:hypothetical protein
MAEVGVGKLAPGAGRVGQAGWPALRSQFRKQWFQQPPLLALFCLMRYADWSFREAAVRLAAHAELHAALGQQPGPDYTSVYRFRRRLAEAVLEQLLRTTIPRLLPARGRQAPVAVEATGLAPGPSGPSS